MKRIIAPVILSAYVVLCTGAAFTHLVSGDSSVDKDTINQLRFAHRERALACGVGWTPTNFVGGEVAHEAEEWGGLSSVSGMQSNLVMRLVPAFVDRTVDPTTTNTIVMWTVPTWQQECGLTNEGVFRRLTDASLLPDPGTNWLYGIAQPGDIVGKWLWEDLQAGYSALKKTKRTGSTYSGTRIMGRDGWWNTLCETVRAAAAAAYESAAPISFPYVYGVLANHEKSGFQHRWTFSRGGGYSRITGIYTNIEHSASIYFRPANFSGTPNPSGHFTDLDGIGISTNDVLYHYEDYGANNDLTNTSSYVSFGTNHPNDITTLDCATVGGEGMSFYQQYWVLDWTFTNSD